MSKLMVIGQAIGGCPKDPRERADSYCLGSLGPSEVAVFEEHVAACHDCAEIVRETRRFVRAMCLVSTEVAVMTPLWAEERSNPKIRPIR